MKKVTLILSIILSLSLGVFFCACNEEKGDTGSGEQQQGTQNPNPENPDKDPKDPAPENPDKNPSENPDKDPAPENSSKDPSENPSKDPKPENPDKEESHKHSMKFSKTLKDATCSEKGEELWVCEGCDATETRSVDALGHDFGPVQTGSDGKKYRICSRCQTKDEMEETISYQITLKADTGCNFAITENTRILIYKDSNVYKIIDKAEASLEVELPRYKYIVRADNLGDPYLQTNYCEMSEDKPFCEIVIGNNPDYDPEIQGFVNVGDKMFNFLVKDTKKDPEDYERLYDLAKGKDLIYLDFFFVACSPCEYLLEEHLKFYNTLEQSVKDRVLMIMVDTANGDQPSLINNYRAQKGIPDEIITMSQGSKIFKHVDNNGSTPHGLFFDKDLVCFDSSNGANFGKYVRERIMGEATSASQQTLFPGKRYF